MGLDPDHNVWTFLRSALTPPSREAVEQGMQTLHAVGAIEGGTKGQWIVQQGAGRATWRLSELGKHLAQLPLDVRLGRMLIYAAVFGCIDPILTVAATMSTRSPFVCPFEKRAEANRAKRAFSKPRDKSDHILAVRAYDAWLAVCAPPSPSLGNPTPETPERAQH
jgi:ATP-dependent RNA helicase DHX57